MHKTKQIITLPEGRFEADLLFFEEEDRQALFRLYRLWRDLSDKLLEFHGRGVNLPEALSEGAFALEMNAPRVIGAINGANASFDCYRIETQERIQVKACSVLPDLTSFGPRSVWDKLYFCDFYRQGEWDGTFDIYLINNDDIYNHHVNAHQTLREQQTQGRRPRFSIYKDIIQANGLIPVITGNLSV